MSGSINMADLINNERCSVIAQFCRRVQAVIWNRRLIKTKQGNLGITKKNIQFGDRVCILYGCSVPVVLRFREKSSEQWLRDLKFERQEWHNKAKEFFNKWKVLRAETGDCSHSSAAYYFRLGCREAEKPPRSLTASI